MGHYDLSDDWGPTNIPENAARRLRREAQRRDEEIVSVHNQAVRTDPFDIKSGQFPRNNDLMPYPFEAAPVRAEGADPPEVRIIDPVSGGQKGQKLARFDLIPPGPLKLLAEHFGRGAMKYEDRNWERGYRWSLSFGALNRHLWAWWGGEDIDPETGSNHMVAVAWHSFALLYFSIFHKDKDDRPSAVAARSQNSSA